MALPPSQPAPHAEKASPRLAAAEFAELFGECYCRLWTLAAGILGDREEANDVVQDAAVVALGRLDQFTADTNFLAWMAKIVRFKALNAARKRAGRKTTAADPNLLDQHHADPGDNQPRPTAMPQKSVDLIEFQDDFDDAVMHALRLLAPEPRACLLLRVIYRMSYREISSWMELPEGTAMSHVHRAKKVIRRKLVADSEQIVRLPK